MTIMYMYQVIRCTYLGYSSQNILLLITCLLPTATNYVHLPHTCTHSTFFSTNNETGACSVDFDNTVTFSVSVTLEDCTKAKNLRYVISLAHSNI